MQVMPSEQIYMLETIINRLDLQPGIRINDVNSISISFKFAQLINFDIDTECFTQLQIEADSNETGISMNYGKTFLFIAKPSTLRQLLQTEPLTVTLYEGNRAIGTATENWKKEFSDMIKYFESLGIVKSTTVEDSFELHNVQGTLTGKMDIFLRMSCYGSNLQTMFQIKTLPDKTNEYIFRQRNASKVFKVEKYSDDRCQPLIAPMYGAPTDTKTGQFSQINMKENVSLTQLFDREFGLMKDVSNIRGPNADAKAEGADEGIMLNFQDDYDKVSICFRPSENKFFDLLDLITADVKTKETHTEVTIQRKKVNRVESFIKSVGGNLRSNMVIEEDENFLEMSADRIAKKLCGNKDCPAAQKFKDYGIGPLATGKNLGTLYYDENNVVEPPVTYGLSHTYGTMCEYGPYGVFSRPKHEKLPFIPRNEDATLISKKPCRIMNKKRSKSGKSPSWHSKTCPLCPERLKGGADENENKEVERKSPILECKSIMDQFDNILSEYKKTLGPCGYATCPYAQTFAEDTCKKMCDNPLKNLPDKENNASSISCDDDPCNIEGCPRYPAGCGSQKCAYTKYKLGLVDDDAALELQFLPPALGGNCGDKQCKYPLSPPLPPIHWDCPDPLPKGACRNLNCPLHPPALKRFKTKKEIKTGPCGSPFCPYVFPQPCSAPTCPFKMTPCPMAKKKSANNNGNGDDDELCENPDCPFASTDQKNLKGKEKNPVEDSDNKIEGEFQDCINPACPFKKPNKENKKKNKKSKKVKKTAPCGNPQCPSIVEQKKNSDDDSSICSNPECPERKKMNKKSSSSSSSSSSSDKESVCSDPECPYANLKTNKKKSKKSRRKTSNESVQSCHRKDDESVCSNSECPERKSRAEENSTADQCPIPGCPYSKKEPKTDLSKCNDPNCPYLKPLPSCGILGCPYEPIPLKYSCKNPKCPSKSINFNKSNKSRRSKLTLESDSSSVKKSNNMDNLAIRVKTTICEDENPCDEPILCDNPECEMKQEIYGSNNNNKRKNGRKTEEMIARKKHKNAKGRKKRSKFVYSIGDSYPGTKVGHKECVIPVFNVPPHMGWLWNVHTPILQLKPRRGWRPGALTRTIASRIRAHRQSKGLGFLRVPEFRKDGGQFDEEGDSKVVPKPTLQIQKKEGAYWITMNPLKDPFSLVENEDPYMECTPMTFKITKPKKPTQDEFCYCDGDGNNNNGEENPEDAKSVSSSSDSELDIEFTPPAGIIHPERFKKRPNVACCEAQYDPTDFEVPKKDKKGDKKGGKEKKGKGGGKKEKGGKKGKKK